jgi:predicted Rdx family selenoprotein
MRHKYARRKLNLQLRSVKTTTNYDDIIFWNRKEERGFPAAAGYI